MPDRVALIRGLLPGGPTLLKPDTIALMMTNQLAGGVWMNFPAVGRLPGKAFGLAGGLILRPSPLDHENSTGELFWGGVAGTQWWISPQANLAGVMMTQRQMAFLHPFAFEFKRVGVSGGQAWQVSRSRFPRWRDDDAGRSAVSKIAHI